MNALLRTAVLSLPVLLSVLGLAACAGMQERSGSTYVAPQRAPSLLDDDHAYVSRVESIARRRGIQVVWIHVPPKHLVAKQDDK